MPFQRAPSLFHLRYSDGLLAIVSWSGVLLSAAVVVGLVEAAPLAIWMLVWFVLWALYLSIVNIGQTFYAFGWESLLLEAGAIAIFLGPARTAPPTAVIWLLRWLLFRVEFGAGLIKLRGDRCCWRPDSSPSSWGPRGWPPRWWSSGCFGGSFFGSNSAPA